MRISAQQVNIAHVLDGSSSSGGSTNFDIEKEFVKNVTASFAESNLFANGGTASYVQFSWGVSGTDTGTFYSLDAFNNFVDNNTYIGGGNNICAGIIAASNHLNAAPDASVAFMFVVINRDDDVGSNVTNCADDARADGITLMAIGVGEEYVKIFDVNENGLISRPLTRACLIPRALRCSTSPQTLLLSLLSV